MNPLKQPDSQPQAPHGGPQENSEIKVERVVKVLQGGRKPGFVQIADELDEVPWECAGGLAEPRSSRRARRGVGKQRRIFSVKG
jgi:hypothetical protein